MKQVYCYQEEKVNCVVDHYLQIVSLKKIEEKQNGDIYVLVLSDSLNKYKNFVIRQKSEDKVISVYDIINIKNIKLVKIKTDSKPMFIINSFKIYQSHSEIIGNPIIYENNTNPDNNIIENRFDKGREETFTLVASTHINSSNNSKQDVMKNQNSINEKRNLLFNSGNLDKVNESTEYIPLSQITTFTKDIHILVRCCSISDFKQFQTNKGGDGSLFSFIV